MAFFRRTWVGTCSLVVLACAGPEAQDSGQTGSIGGSECVETHECVRQLQAWRAGFEQPTPLPLTFSGSRCEMYGLITSEQSVSGPACVCELTEADGASLAVGPAGIDCLLRGRNGECVWESAEFTGCQVGAVGACEATCEELLERKATADAVSYRTEQHLVRCAGKGSCESIVSVEQQCYVNQVPVALSCAEPPQKLFEELARKLEQDTPGPCSEVGSGSAGGVCSVETPPESYFPRDPSEWQGMRVDLNVQPPCDESVRCGLARACVDGLCTGCLSDAECAAGELCALEHCVPASQVACRTRHDCTGGSLCALDGYTGGTARGNEEMHAYCLGSSGSAKAL